MKKTIGIAIPVHHSHIKFLDRILEHINNSTILPNIVSISCSGINEEIKIKKYDFEIILTTNIDNKNASQNRNIAASKLDTDIISFIDCDDIPHPQRNEYLLKCFEYCDSPVVHDYVISGVLSTDLLKIKYDNLIYYENVISGLSPVEIAPVCSHRPVNYANGHVSVKKEMFNDYKFDETIAWGEDSYYNRKFVSDGIFLSYIENKLSNYITR
jgi:glycosyltransferase involved in cell wall biosynthesis